MRAASEVFYYLPGGWRSTASVTTSQDNRAIEPDRAFAVRGTGPQVTADAWLVIAGAETETALATTIGAGATDTTVTLQRAAGLKLRDAALLAGGAFEGSADTQAANRRDELLVYDNATGGINQQPSARYYYDLSAGLWRATIDPAADAGDTVLAPGAFLTIRSAGGAATTWTLPPTP